MYSEFAAAAGWLRPVLSGRKTIGFIHKKCSDLPIAVGLFQWFSSVQQDRPPCLVTDTTPAWRRVKDAGGTQGRAGRSQQQRVRLPGLLHFTSLCHNSSHWWQNIPTTPECWHACRPRSNAHPHTLIAPPHARTHVRPHAHARARVRESDLLVETFAPSYRSWLGERSGEVIYHSGLHARHISIRFVCTVSSAVLLSSPLPRPPMPASPWRRGVPVAAGAPVHQPAAHQHRRHSLHRRHHLQGHRLHQRKALRCAGVLVSMASVCPSYRLMKHGFPRSRVTGFERRPPRLILPPPLSIGRKNVGVFFLPKLNFVDPLPFFADS